MSTETPDNSAVEESDELAEDIESGVDEEKNPDRITEHPSLEPAEKETTIVFDKTR